MKILSLLLLTVFLERAARTKQANLESAVIEYTANSRGFNKITIQNQMVLISKDRSGNAKAVATKIAADDWEELVFEKIELDNLSKLKRLPKSVL
jgi:hypothetical protein